MARDFIKINRNDANAIYANMLLDFVGTMRNAIETGTLIKGIMDHNHDGSIFTDIEALFGVPANNGQTVYNFVNGSMGAMNGTFQNSDGKNLTERLG